MQKFAKLLLIVSIISTTIIYVVSPVDLYSGPIDDVIVMIIGVMTIIGVRRQELVVEE